MISPGLGEKVEAISRLQNWQENRWDVAQSFGTSERRRRGGKKEGLVHLDVNGSALSTVPQLKFNEASPFCSTGSVRCYWLSVLSSADSFPDNDQQFSPIGVSLNKPLKTQTSRLLRRLLCLLVLSANADFVFLGRTLVRWAAFAAKGSVGNAKWKQCVIHSQ